MRTYILWAAALLAASAAGAQAPVGVPLPPRVWQSDVARQQQRQRIAETISSWPPESKAAADDMLARYGPPRDVTGANLTWYNLGPWKRIRVVRGATPHNFPARHMDVLYETIGLEIPADKIADIARFDGSLMIDRTRGEITSACETEAMNILALDAAHDIAAGRLDWRAARKRYARQLQALARSKKPPVFTFPMPSGPTGDADVPLLR